MLEGVQDPSTLGMAGAAIDERLLEHHSIVAQSKDVVCKHNDLVTPHLQAAAGM